MTEAEREREEKVLKVFQNTIDNIKQSIVDKQAKLELNLINFNFNFNLITLSALRLSDRQRQVFKERVGANFDPRRQLSWAPPLARFSVGASLSVGSKICLKTPLWQLAYK
jgi:hypothetical protein